MGRKNQRVSLAQCPLNPLKYNANAKAALKEEPFFQSDSGTMRTHFPLDAKSRRKKAPANLNAALSWSTSFEAFKTTCPSS
jgi:hypothetical protein